jgi:putative membrane protein
MQIQKHVLFHKPNILIAVILVFYTVGIVGMSLPDQRDYFASLSFLNLLLSFGIVLLARKIAIKRFIGFLAFCFSIGFVAELIGVHTGLLFGSYHYGENLGVKVFEVPLIIGLNWGVLVVISASLVERFHMSIYFKVLLATTLMVFLDFLMEPIANDLDFWHWRNDQIPLYNFVCWFAISLILQYFYFNFNKLAESNRVFNVLYFVMVVFFSLLNLL